MGQSLLHDKGLAMLQNHGMSKTTRVQLTDEQKQECARLQQLLTAFPGLQAKIAASLSVTPSAVNQQVRGWRPLNLPTAAAFAKATGQSLGQISPRLQLEASKLLNATSAAIALPSSSPHEPVPVQTGLVPVLGVAQLGADGFWAAGDLGAAGGYVDFKSQDEQAYALKVVGDSMHPRIKSGEYVVAEPSHAYGAGDEVVVVTTDGRAMVKEFVYRREGQVALNSVNNGHGRLTLPEDEIESIHYVVAITKPSLFRPG